jgi:hypothetical protein
LSILCGLKVQLIFSDIENPQAYHSFVNECPRNIHMKSFVSDNNIHDDCVFYDYSIFDYPFENIGPDSQKVSVKGIPVVDELADLGKRHRIDFELLECIPTRDDRKRTKNAHMKLDSALIKVDEPLEPTLNHITSEHHLDKLLDLMLRKPEFNDDQQLPWRSADEQAIILSSAKLFLRGYFGQDSDHMASVLRKFVPLSQMKELLKKINETAHPRTAAEKIRSYVYFFTELIVNPSAYDPTGSAPLKSAEAFSTVFGFFTRQTLQNIRLLDGLYSGDRRKACIKLITFDSLPYIETLLWSFFNLLLFERLRENHHIRRLSEQPEKGLEALAMTLPPPLSLHQSGAAGFDYSQGIRRLFNASEEGGQGDRLMASGSSIPQQPNFNQFLTSLLQGPKHF